MNRFFDQLGPIVEGIDLDPLGQCLLNGLNFFFDILDNLSAISTHDHHHHSDDSFTVPVARHRALPEHRCETRIADVFDPDGSAIAALKHDVADIVERRDQVLIGPL